MVALRLGRQGQASSWGLLASNAGLVEKAQAMRNLVLETRLRTTKEWWLKLSSSIYMYTERGRRERGRKREGGRRDGEGGRERETVVTMDMPSILLEAQEGGEMLRGHVRSNKLTAKAGCTACL